MENIRAWLDKLEPGFAAEFGDAFDEVGLEDSSDLDGDITDDASFIKGLLDHLKENGAKPEQIHKISMALKRDSDSDSDSSVSMSTWASVSDETADRPTDHVADQPTDKSANEPPVQANDAEAGVRAAAATEQRAQVETANDALTAEAEVESQGAAPKSTAPPTSTAAASPSEVTETPFFDVDSTTGIGKGGEGDEIDSLNSIARSFSETSLTEGVSNTLKRSATVDAVQVVVAATAESAIARALSCSNDAAFVAGASSEEVRDLHAQVCELQNALRSSREMHYEELDKLKVTIDTQRHEKLEIDRRVQSQYEALTRANEEAHAAKVEFDGKEKVLRNLLEKTRQEKQGGEEQFQQRMADEHSRLLNEITSHKADSERFRQIKTQLEDADKVHISGLDAELNGMMLKHAFERRLQLDTYESDKRVLSSTLERLTEPGAPPLSQVVANTKVISLEKACDTAARDWTEYLARTRDLKYAATAVAQAIELADANADQISDGAARDFRLLQATADEGLAKYVEHQARVRSRLMACRANLLKLASGLLTKLELNGDVADGAAHEFGMGKGVGETRELSDAPLDFGSVVAMLYKLEPFLESEEQVQRMVDIVKATLTTFFELADISSMAAAQRALRKQIGERLLTIAMVTVSQAAEKGKRTDGINKALEKISLRAHKASEARTRANPIVSRPVTVTSAVVSGGEMGGSSSDDDQGEYTVRTATTPCRVLKQSGPLLLVKARPCKGMIMGAPPGAAANPAVDVEMNKLMSWGLATGSRATFLPEGILTDTTFAGATIGPISMEAEHCLPGATTIPMSMEAGARGLAAGGKSPATKDVRGYSDILDRLNELNAERIGLESQAEVYRSTMYKYEDLLPVQVGAGPLKKARRRPGSSSGFTKTLTKSPLSHGMSHSAVSPGGPTVSPLRRKARRTGW